MRLFPATQREGSGEAAPGRSLLLPIITCSVAVAEGGGPPSASAARAPALRRGLLIRGRRIGDLLFEGSATAFAIFVVGLVFAVVVSLWLKSQDAFNSFGFQLFFGNVWLPGGQPASYGSLPLVLGTLVTSAIAVMIGVPVSILIAVFLSELAPPWLRAPVSIIVELLAAIPSVVYGLWGIFFLAPFLREHVYPRLQANWGWTGLFGGTASGYSVLTAGILLAVMIIPTVSALSREVLRAVPVSQREAAYAVGATRWEVIRKAVLPYGRTGLFGATILGLARAIGETMAVTMVIGNRNVVFDSLLSPGNTIPSTLANETYEASGIHLSALFGLGIILFIIALVVNIAARLLLRRMWASTGEGRGWRVRSSAPPLEGRSLSDIVGVALRAGWWAVGFMIVGGVLAGAWGALGGAVAGVAFSILVSRGSRAYGARKWTSVAMLGVCAASLSVAMVPLLSILYEVFSRGLPVFARWNQAAVQGTLLWGFAGVMASTAAVTVLAFVLKGRAPVAGGSPRGAAMRAGDLFVAASRPRLAFVSAVVLLAAAFVAHPLAGAVALGAMAFLMVKARGAPSASGGSRAAAAAWRDSIGTAAKYGVFAVPLAGLLMVFSAGPGFLDWDFFYKRQIFQYAAGGGIGNAIYGSLIIVGFASLMGIPVGIFAGIYLSEFGRGRLAEFIRFFADVFAEFPSIVIGLFAYSVVVVTTGKFSVFAGAFALAVLMVPIVTRTTEEALHLVPDSVREAALALGIPRWRVTLRVVLSTARAALVTGAMLAFARIFGETAPLIITIGGALYFAGGIDESSSALTYIVWRGATSGIPAAETRAWGAAALLLFIVLAINMTVRFVTLRQSSKAGSSL